MAETKLNREYALSIVGVGALMVGICVWSLYDGMRGWPGVNAEMDAVRPALLATNLTATAWLERGDDGVTEIDRLFAASGRKAPGRIIRKISELKLPDTHANDTASQSKQAEQLRELIGKPIYSEHDITTQWIQASVTLIFGLLAFLTIGLKAGRRFIADDRGLSGNGFGPQPIAYADIAAIDWAKWDEKGIILLTLSTGRRIKLDGWHYAGMAGVSDMLREHRPDLAPKAQEG